MIDRPIVTSPEGRLSLVLLGFEMAWYERLKSLFRIERQTW